MRILWRTDVHLSDRTPRSRTDNWTETCLSKLRQVYEIAKAERCDLILDGGDFFDIKSPSMNSHQMIARYCALHSEYGVPVWACVGNHDCVYGDYSFLPQQPLEVLFSSGVFNRLYDHHTLVRDDVKIVGIPYHGVRYNLDRFREIRKDYPSQKLVVVAHLLASPTQSTMYDQEDVVHYRDLPQLCPDASIFYFGHWHQDQGITTLPSGQQVVNVGSLSRGALSQDNFDRQPKVVLLDTDTMTLTEIPLVVSSPMEVFRVEQKILEDSRQVVMSEFADHLQAALTTSSERDLRDVVMGIVDLDPKVREQALLYLERNP